MSGKIHSESRNFVVGKIWPVHPESPFIQLLEREPVSFDPESVAQLIMNAVASGASDVTIQTSRQVRTQIHGRHYRATDKRLSDTEVEAFLIHIYRATNAMAEIKGRKVLDFAWEISDSRESRQRFRVNATGILASNNDGVEITMRALPKVTPTLESVSLMQRPVLDLVPNFSEQQRREIEARGDFIGLPQHMFPALTPRNGIVVIAGATGQGKSTTMAAIVNFLLRDIAHPRKIIDFQAPIEYTFYDVLYAIEGSASMLGQSEVGLHIPDFAYGVRSALRRAPDVICIGEARDLETILAAIEASLTGHNAMTTTHAGSTGETLRRMTQTFPAQEREGRAFDLMTSLRFIISQYLVPKVGGGRVPIREYFHFDEDMRSLFIRKHPDKWGDMIDDAMDGKLSYKPFCQPMWSEVEILLRNGVISQSTADQYLARKKTGNILDDLPAISTAA